MSQRMQLVLGVVAGIAVFIGLGIYLRGPKPEDVPTPQVASPNQPNHLLSEPKGEEESGGFTFAFSGRDANDENEIGCGTENVCLVGRFAPDLAVRVLLQNGDSCTGRTGDAHHFSDGAIEEDITTLLSFDGCLATDVGPDGTVAIVAVPDLIDATFKWLPVMESEEKPETAFADKAAQATLEKFAKTYGQKVPPVIIKTSAGRVSLAAVKSAPTAGQRAHPGPIFALTTGKPVHLGEAEELCQTITGAFELGASTYLVADSGVCESDSGGRVIFEWNQKEWKTVVSTESYFP